MARTPIDLSKARVLISNDDGINAPGIRVLEHIVADLCAELWTVAPEMERSGAGHSLTLRRPLRVRHVSGNRYAVDGTPTDCILMAVNQIMTDCRPDIILSGINRGGNLGEDVTYSGTIAAAMEGTLLGIPSIAFSQVFRRREGVHWRTSEAYLPQVLHKMVGIPWPDNVLINVNFPPVLPDDVDGISVVRQGRSKIGGQVVPMTDPRGEEIYWIGGSRDLQGHPKGTDINAIHENRVTVTPISVDMTHHEMVEEIRTVF